MKPKQFSFCAVLYNFRNECPVYFQYCRPGNLFIGNNIEACKLKNGEKTLGISHKNIGNNRFAGSFLQA